MENENQPRLNQTLTSNIYTGLSLRFLVTGLLRESSCLSVMFDLFLAHG